MASSPQDHATPYEYQPLESGRHVRLLQILDKGDGDTGATASYTLVHVTLEQAKSAGFEAVSYTWGDPSRTSGLELAGGGHVGLTRNLTQALPHLTAHSRTGALWIDQICINQSDDDEKGAQVALMGEIYAGAGRTVVWLGPEDDSSALVRRWLAALGDFFARQGDRPELTPGRAGFHPGRRALLVAGSWTHPGTDPVYAPACHRFLHRPWFSRGWVVQEVLLSREVSFVAGGLVMGMQDLSDMKTVPRDAMPDELRDGTEGCYHLLVTLKLFTPAEEQPLAFLKLMSQVSGEFGTFLLRDQLFAYLGLSGVPAHLYGPDYGCPVRDAFARFAVSLADGLGSLDFLSMCSTWQDDRLPDTPDELRGLPTWVPSWSALPLIAPYRLVPGGVRVLNHELAWDAAGGSRHVGVRGADAPGTGRLLVQAKIVDRIAAVSDAMCHKCCGQSKDPVRDEHLDDLAGSVKDGLGEGFPRLDAWDRTQLVSFLNAVSWNGVEPDKTAEEILQRRPLQLAARPPEDWPLPVESQALDLCLDMARHRRFMRSARGRLGLVPKLGTILPSTEGEGPVIAVVRGCRVPLVLQAVPSAPGHSSPPSDATDRCGAHRTYKVVGDCYVEGIMHGEAAGAEWLDTLETIALV